MLENKFISFSPIVKGLWSLCQCEIKSLCRNILKFKMCSEMVLEHFIRSHSTSPYVKNSQFWSIELNVAFQESCYTQIGKLAFWNMISMLNNFTCSNYFKRTDSIFESSYSAKIAFSNGSIECGESWNSNHVQKNEEEMRKANGFVKRKWNRRLDKNPNSAFYALHLSSFFSFQQKIWIKCLFLHVRMRAHTHRAFPIHHWCQFHSHCSFLLVSVSFFVSVSPSVCSHFLFHISFDL